MNRYTNRLLVTIFSLLAIVSCGDGSEDEKSYESGNLDIEFETPFEDYSPYITAVYDFQPAPGQHINTYPSFTEGETKEDILAKIETGFADKGNGTLIALGGFGGYVVFGFDHTIPNKESLCDLRIYGNAFANSAEPGIVMVSRDDNGNGIPDDIWYEIKGSDHDAEGTIADYSITYTYDGTTTVAWEDNQGDNGTVLAKYPGWINEATLTFTGTRLADVYTGSGTLWVGTTLLYGYVDNQANTSDHSAIDIGWAVDSDGNPANLGGIDFVKVYNSQRQVAGWLGDVSTDITGAEDLHLLGTVIYSADVMAE